MSLRRALFARKQSPHLHGNQGDRHGRKKRGLAMTLKEIISTKLPGFKLEMAGKIECCEEIPAMRVGFAVV